MKYMRLILATILFAVMLLPATSYAKTRFGRDVVVRKGTTVNEAVSFGGDVIVRGKISGDAVSFGGDVIVELGGEVEGDAVSIGDDIYVRTGGRIRGDAVAIGGDIDTESGGRIDGDSKDLNSFSGPKAMKYILPHSIVGAGSIFVRSIFGPFSGLFGAFGFLLGFLMLIVKLSISFGIAALIAYFFPKNVSEMAGYLQESFPKALIVGIAVLVCIPFMLLFFVVSIIGIPLVPLVILFLFIIHIFGSVGIALWIGYIIPESETRSIMINVLLGVLVVGLLKHIPIIGLFVGLAFWAASFGVVVSTKFGTHGRTIT